MTCILTSLFAVVFKSLNQVCRGYEHSTGS
uniref:Uncharacterized protein n=1 Tax=Anguilla anguilla TaxID=7936 RepID=A0A0E9XPU1_ANGAN